MSDINQSNPHKYGLGDLAVPNNREGETDEDLDIEEGWDEDEENEDESGDYADDFVPSAPEFDYDPFGDLNDAERAAQLKALNAGEDLSELPYDMDPDDYYDFF